jgi:predicted esterase
MNDTSAMAARPCGASEHAFPFLLQRPTPHMRLLSIVGSGLFVGIMGYFTWSSHQAQKQKSLQSRR